MKSTAPILSALCTLAAGVALESRRVSYDGYKVVRLAVGSDASKVNEIVDRLQLTTWKGKPRAGAFADIVVPPSQIGAFDAATAGMEAQVMHNDLGLSIADESNFATYAGKVFNFPHTFVPCFSKLTRRAFCLVCH